MKAQGLTSRTVLCPSLLPRPTISSATEPGVAPQPIGVMATNDPNLLSYGTGPGSVFLNFTYQAPYENDPSKDRPDRFLHFEVYVRGKCCAPPSDANPAVLGGKTGLLLRAGEPGAYFANHVRFFWSQSGTAYVATLHEFGAGTTALLGALVSGLEPVKALAATPAGPTGGRSVPVPGMTGPVGVVVGGGSVWVSSIGDATSVYKTAAWPGSQTGPGLQRFEPSTLRPEGAVVRLAGGTDWMPSGLASAFGRVWTVVESYPKPPTLFGLDPATGHISAKYSLPISSSKDGAVTSITASGDALWISVYGPATIEHVGEFGGMFSPGSVWRVGPTTGHVVAHSSVGAGTVAVAATDDAVWACNYLDDTVSRISPSTNRVLATVPVGAGPTAIAAGSSGVWVTNSLDGTVSRIDPATSRVVATIRVGQGPMGVASGTGGVWITNYLSDTVSRIDPSSNVVAETMPVGHGPIGIAENGGRLFVTNDLDATLTEEAEAARSG